jgi:hypothetical protein
VRFRVFATAEHEGMDEHVSIDAKTIELSASQTIRIRAGKSIITVPADGEVQVRGRNVTSRASNMNRVRGGSVRLGPAKGSRDGDHRGQPHGSR